MPQQLFTNFAHSQLAAGIASGDLVLSVTGGHGARFPVLSGGDYFTVVLENALAVREIVRVTARATDTFTIVRAQEGTAAVAWVAGDVVTLRPTADYLNRLPQQTSTTGSLVPPSGTTAQRDGSPVASYFRYNTTLARFEGYSSAWAQFAIQSGLTGALAIPSGTTAQRDTTLGVGIRYNSTTLSFEGYNGSTWGSIGGGATGGAGNPVFWENDQLVTVDYTIPAAKNAGTFGPVTINTGITVTVSTGATWSIV